MEHQEDEEREFKDLTNQNLVSHDHLTSEDQSGGMLEEVLTNHSSHVTLADQSENLTGEYKVAAARVLLELERTLGHDLEDSEQFMFVHGTVASKLPDKPRDTGGKCGLKCEEAVREAEVALAEARLEAGLVAANTAALLAPAQTPDGLAQLSAALHLRSLLLLRLGHPELALRDAGLAPIKGAFPATQLWALYQHQGRCHEALKSGFDAQKCYNRAISALDKSDLDEEAKLVEKKLIQETLNTLNKNPGAKAKPAVTKKTGEELSLPRRHPKYPALSPHVSVQYCQEKGRYARAAADIRPGTVLGVEDPAVSVLGAEQLLARCLVCFVRVLAPLPCHHCSEVVFCSLECRRCAMSTFHKYECQNMHLLQSGPNFLALRAVTQNSLEFFLQNRKKKFEHYDDSSGTELEGSKKYSSNDMRNLFNLSTKNTDMEKKLEKYMVGAYLLKILQTMNYFDSEKKNEGSLTEEEVFIGMLLSHFVGVAESNSHVICTAPLHSNNLKNLPEILQKDFEPEHIGVGINSTLAFFNHSCNPNTIKIQRGRKTFLIAAENIKKGEDIHDNYGALFYTTPAARRQTSLGFRCSCEPCAEDWPLYRDLTDRIAEDSDLGGAEVTRQQLERGRAANSLMARMNAELGLGHLGRVLSLAGEYRAVLAALVTQPHRFYFNNYMIMFFCYWIKYGNVL